MDRAGFERLVAGPAQVVISSVGTADMSSGRQIADALGLDRHHVDRCIWQSPVVLLTDLDIFAAHRWQRFLVDLGLDVDLCPSGTPCQTQSSPLLDVAICPAHGAFGNGKHRGRLAQDLGRFLGLPAKVVADEFRRSPGWVLHQISTANAAAMRRRFAGPGVSVRVSDPRRTRFDLDTRTMTRPAREALDRALAMIGPRRAGSLPSYLARSLSGSFAGQGLRLIDRAFRDHAVRLTAPPGSAVAWAALRALSGRGGGRDDHDLKHASPYGPAILDRGLDVYEAPEAAAAYRGAGLIVDVIAEPLGPMITPRRAQLGSVPRG